MKLRLAPLLLGTVLLVGAAPSQEPSKEPTWEQAVAALYAVISGPVDQERDWEAFVAMFAASGNLMVSIPTPEGSSRLLVLTPEEYVERSGAMVTSMGFTEKEIGRRAERFGNVVQVFSSYEGKAAASPEREPMRGVNSIQLVRTAEGWKIANLLYEQASALNPLPEALLTVR